MGRFSSIRLRAVATSLALALAVLAAAGAPADAARRPPGPEAGGARRALRRAHRAGARSAGTRPSGPRATTCGSRATGASPRRCRRSTCAPRTHACCSLPDAGSGRCARRARSTRAGRTSRRSSCARRATPTRPRARPRCGSRRSPPTASRSCSAPRRDDGYVARYELLAGQQGHRPRQRRAADRAEPRPARRLFTLRVRAVDGVGHVSALSPVAHARTRPCTDTIAARRARQRARDHDRGHERRARLGSPRTIPTAPSSATPCTATACCSASPARTGFLASHLAPATPLQPSRSWRSTAAATSSGAERARPHDPGAAARDGPRLRLHAGDHGRELRGPAAPLHADRRRLADLLPPRPRPRHPRPGRPARDRLGAPARHRRRAARGVAGPGHPARAALEPGQPLRSGRSHLGARRRERLRRHQHRLRGRRRDRPPAADGVREPARADAARPGREADDGRRRQDRRDADGPRRLLRLSRARRHRRPAVRDGLGPALGDEPVRPDLGRHLGGEDHQVHHDRPELPALHDRHAAVRLRLAAGRQGHAAASGTT